MNEENNGNQYNDIEEIEDNSEIEKKEVEDAINDGTNLAKNVATGNAAGAIKDTAKLAMNKKVRKKIIIHSISKIIIPFSIIIFLAASILGIFNAVGDIVQSIIEGVSDFFNVDESDGSINISNDQIDAIIKAIEDLGVSAEDLKLLGDYTESATEEEKQEALRKYIRKFYEAQVVTETLNYYHKESTDTKTYGAVYVYRATGEYVDETNVRKELTYISYDKMTEMQLKNNTAALNYFSIDPSGNLVIAGKVQTIVEKGSNINSLSKESDITIVNLRSINYKSAIAQYTTQMNFLLYLTMISQNPEFVAALTDLIKDSRLEITVMDDVSTNVNINTKTYTQHRKWTETQTVGSGETQREETVQRRSSTNVTDITKTTTITTSPSVKLTYVKTWFCEQRITYKKKIDGPNLSSTTNTYPDEPEPSGDGSWKTNQVEKIDVTITNEKYEELVREDVKFILGERGDAERYKNGQIPEPTFIGLMETKFRIPYSTREEEAGSNLVSGAEMLFYLLQKDSKLENMEQIMRYALYLYSGKDYGVTSLDGSIFEIGDFITAGGGGSSSSLLKEYIREWENSGGAPTNADGTKYIIEDDGAGNLVVGYGVDIYNGGFANLFIEAGYTLEIGAEVDVDFVDNLEQQEIDSNISSVKSITSGLNLKEYQIHALVSRAYNCGVAGALTTTRGSPAMNFVNSYKTYWKETDDQFEQKNNNANFSHSLYTQYMSKPVTASGNYMAGLERRRKSEWTLFQTGYYDVLGKWYEEGGSIVECAREIHQYMEQNSYTYCVYGTNSLEECSKYGKSHGLNNTFEESKNGYHNVCCATYVKWVLQEAGYLGVNEGSNSANELSNILAQKGWTLITDESQLKPGDILSYSGHVEIYAGDGKVYNAGSGNAIRNASPSYMSGNFEKAYRAPN